MTRFWKSAPFLVLVIFAMACGLGAQKESAERVAEGYFKTTAAGATTAAMALYDDRFFETTPREKWAGMLEGFSDKLGTYQDHKLLNWWVNVQAGPPNPGYYTTLRYQVKYSKAETIETFVLYAREQSAEPRIVGQNVTSDAFMAK